MQTRHKKIGLALGGGSARGWAHIGVIRALNELGIEPEIICGTSIGALVGAAYASGTLDELETWVLTLDWQETAKFLDISFHGGLIEGKKLFDFFSQTGNNLKIEDLPKKYSAVATDLESGSEIWLKEGSVLDAVRASIALPGLFNPVYQDGKWLSDGGLVNPVPVSLCRAMGADIVIAVDLISSLAGRHLKEKNNQNDIDSPLANTLKNLWSNIVTEDNNKPRTPGLFETLASAINIMQIQITRSHFAIEPPDVLITPQMADIELFEFYRAREAIEEGKKAVMESRSELLSLS